MYSFSMTIENRLKVAREKAGYESAEAAANAFGWSSVTYRSHENGIRGIKNAVATKYARAFKTTPEWLLYGKSKAVKTVPLVGYVSAGGEFHTFNDQSHLSIAAEDGESFEHKNGIAGFDYDTVDAPPDCPPDARAVEIRGDSMFPVYKNGDVLIYTGMVDTVDLYLNDDCICQLESGEMVIKTLTAGSKSGLWTLISFNAPVMKDVIVMRVAKIQWVKKR